MNQKYLNLDSGVTLPFKLLPVYASYRYCHEIKKKLGLVNGEVFSLCFNKKEKRFKYDGLISKGWVGNNIKTTLGGAKGKKLKNLWKDPIKVLVKHEDEDKKEELEKLWAELKTKSIEYVLKSIEYESLFKEKFKDIDFKKVPDENCPAEEQIKWVESLIRCWLEMPIKYNASDIQNIALKALEEKPPIKAICVKYVNDIANDAKYWPPGEKSEEGELPFLEGKSEEKLKLLDERKSAFSFHLLEILFGALKLKDPQIYSFPIYDVYLNNAEYGYGGISGLVCVVLPEGEHQGKEQKEQVEKIITPYLPHWSNDIAQSQLLQISNSTSYLPHLPDDIAQSQLLQIVSSHENTPSFFKHFCELISKMQLWGEVEICSNKTEDAYEKYSDDKYFRWNFHEAAEMFFNESEKDEHEELLHSEIIWKYHKIVVIPSKKSEKELFKNKLLKQQFQIFEVALNNYRRFKSAEQLGNVR